MHGSVLGFFAYGALQGREVEGKAVLEVGSLDVNGTVRPMVEARRPASYVGVDVVDGPGVDRVCDATDLIGSFGMDAFDVVISTEMLEHCDDWAQALANMVAVLRPGGVLLVTTRSPGFAWHHPPDRWRYTQAAMAGIVGALGLEPLVLMDDPEFPGVFVKARKPDGWQPSHGLLGQQAGTDLGAQVGGRDRAGLADEPAAGTQPAADADRQQGGVVVGAVREQPAAARHAGSVLNGIPGVTPMHEPLKILGRPMNPDGTGYYRFWQPYAELARSSGHLVVIPDPGQHQWLPDEDQVAAFDVIAQQRPAGREGLRWWKRWKALGGPKLVYEADDDLLNPDPSGLPHLLDRQRQSEIRECLALADLITCSTEPLAETFRGHNPNVAVIPDYVHADVLAIQRPHRDRVTVGWAGGLTHLQDLDLVRDPLAHVVDATSAELHFLGWDFSPLVRRPARFTPWQDDVWAYYNAVDFDIGVAPLADTPFNRSRACIRTLELAALGIPVVASDVEPYRGFVVDGVTGYLARTEDQWRSRLVELVNDEAARQEMGAKAKAVAADWTIQGNWQRWARAYEELAGWPPNQGGDR
jgi:glycosyltransferase involved in cell wall biosynthesis